MVEWIRDATPHDCEPKWLTDDVVHCVLSHHGRLEWGSPVVPGTPEAMVLHLCDMIDSRMGGAAIDADGKLDEVGFSEGKSAFGGRMRVTKDLRSDMLACDAFAGRPDEEWRCERGEEGARLDSGNAPQ